MWTPWLSRRLQSVQLLATDEAWSSCTMQKKTLNLIKMSCHRFSLQASVDLCTYASAQKEIYTNTETHICLHIYSYTLPHTTLIHTYQSYTLSYTHANRQQMKYNIFYDDACWIYMQYNFRMQVKSLLWCLTQKYLPIVLLYLLNI